MKLCSFIILAEFKFGVMDPIRQIKVIAKISAYTVFFLWHGAYRRIISACFFSEQVLFFWSRHLQFYDKCCAGEKNSGLVIRETIEPWHKIPL